MMAGHGAFPFARSEYFSMTRLAVAFVVLIAALFVAATRADAQSAGRIHGATFAVQNAQDGSLNASDFIVVYNNKAIGQEVKAVQLQARLPSHHRHIVELRASRYAEKKQQVHSAFGSDEVKVIKQYSHLPSNLVRVHSAAALARLRAHPGVAGVYADRTERLHLAESLPFIGQPTAASQANLGAGTAVAVLDTAVDYQHPAFGSCASPGVPSSCKIVYAHDFASSDEFEDNSHGTNVAAIVLGVAPATKIVALDVFTGDIGRSSDLINAINWVIANKATYNIVAMNLSLGSGRYTEPEIDGPYNSAVDDARAAGILTIAAAGNAGYTDALSSPAAVPGVISVGAVYDSAIGSVRWSAINCTDTATTGGVACFSNSASFLEILAPGSVINAADISGSGTSQAAPHVAGAAAVLRAAFPNESLDQIVARLSNGVMVTDAKNSITKPRLDLQLALTGNRNAQTIGAISFSTVALTLGSTATATATATSGLAVTFSSLTAGVCSVSGSIVTGLSAGTCTIAANQAGSTQYSPALQVTQSIAVAAPVRTALFVHSSSSSAKNSLIRLINTTGSAGTLKATAYGETTGQPLGTVGANLGPIAPYQTRNFGAAELERLIGFSPSAPTTKYSVNFSSSELSDFQVINYTDDRATGYRTLSQAQYKDRTTGSTANSVARTAWFMSQAASPNKTNMLRIVNTSSRTATLYASAYDEAGKPIGTSNALLGSIYPHQIGTYFSSSIESALGIAGSALDSTGTSKYRVEFSANLPSLELLNFTRDNATGALALVQAQVDDRPSSPATTSIRHVLHVHASTAGSRTTMLRIINPGRSNANLTAIAYDESGAQVGSGSLGVVAPNQIYALFSDTLEAALKYVPSSPSAKYHLVITADQPAIEVINFTRLAASGNIHLAQAQTNSRPDGAAASTTRNAFIIYPSSNALRTTQLEVINTTSQSAPVTATAYDDNGARISANVNLGTLRANQMLTFTSAQLENLFAYRPPTTTSKWRIVLTANVGNFEVINYARESSTGVLILAQPQTE